MRPPNKSARVMSLPKPANDNEDSKTLTVTCDLPERLGILSGEAELIARFLPELMEMVANDNEVE